MARFDRSKYINPHQMAGIEAYTIEDQPGRGSRVLWVNTGSGLRYRILVDRGFDIDQAFYGEHSLAFLSFVGPAAPTRALDKGPDWLKGFPAGLLTSCGPFNIGRACMDEGQELGLHGTHSNTPGQVESIVQGAELTATGTVRYARMFGPNAVLRRTIRSEVGSNAIEFTDEFENHGNTAVPHAWLLHINLGYPLVDRGTRICYDAKVEPREDEMSLRTFARGNDYKAVTAPVKAHAGRGEAVAYLYPRSGRDGMATVGVVNEKLKLGLAIRYSTKEFPRCGNWQHFGQGEYVTALEPMNGTVAGRDQDRAKGLMDSISAGGKKRYRYSINAVTEAAELRRLLALNRR